MIPGGKTVACPYCGTKKRLICCISGNNFDSKSWSDMKRVLPSMPTSSPVQKCPECKLYYLEYKQEALDYWQDFLSEGFPEVGELSYWEWKEAYKQFCYEDEEKKKNEILKAELYLDKKDWNNIRLWLIHAYNDHYYRKEPFEWIHQAEDTPPQEEYNFIIGIINDYVKSFDWSTVNNPLFKAELFRESHQFDECKKTLETIDFERLEDYEKRVYDEIKTRNDNGDVKVFRILSEEEWRKKCEIEMFEKKKREEEAWIEQENKDKRYKCCINGHCYENLKSSCPWCGETEVADRIDEKTPINYRQLYVGQPYGGRWVLTTNPDVEGKSERIRKITVDMVGKYKLYYHLDGQNPNPLCRSHIKLGDESFMGWQFVQLCDEIIDGGLNNILI